MHCPSFESKIWKSSCSRYTDQSSQKLQLTLFMCIIWRSSHDPSSKHYKNLCGLTQTTGHLTTHIAVTSLQLRLEHFCVKPARHWCQKCWSKEILACERIHEAIKEVCEDVTTVLVQITSIVSTSDVNAVFAQLNFMCKRKVHDFYVSKRIKCQHQSWFAKTVPKQCCQHVLKHSQQKFYNSYVATSCNYPTFLEGFPPHLWHKLPKSNMGPASGLPGRAPSTLVDCWHIRWFFKTKHQ